MKTAPSGGGALAVIGLGASMGDREATLRLAVQALDAADGVEVLRAASLYRSRAMGPGQGWFLNSAVLVRTRRAPRGLLALCKQIEQRLGRRPSCRWADRALDLDILLFGDRVRRASGLCLPHPGLLSRPFALFPAAEVAAGLRHPVAGRPLAALLHGAGPAPARVGVLWGPPARDPLAADGRAVYTGPPSATQRPVRAAESPMKIFLDTANLDEIREVARWGILDGVTTNPSLIAREGRDFVEIIHEICEIVKGPVSAETVATDAASIIEEGRALARVSEHVVVKVPMTLDGLAATRALADEGIDVNVTLVFSAGQALLAAKAGAAYVSPFAGRLDDIGADGMDLIEQIVQIFSNYPELGSEVLVASVRSPADVSAAAQAGADVATVPFAVLKRLSQHPLTDAGLARFLADWETVPDRDIRGSVRRWLSGRR